MTLTFKTIFKNLFSKHLGLQSDQYFRTVLNQTIVYETVFNYRSGYLETKMVICGFKCAILVGCWHKLGNTYGSLLNLLMLQVD